jgi:hypothetical protein
LQVGEKAGKAGLFTNPFATLPHRVGERQVPGCVRNLARAEWFPFGWCGEVLARSKAPWPAGGLDVAQQGNGSMEAAWFEVGRYSDVPADAGGGAAGGELH